MLHFIAITRLYSVSHFSITIDVGNNEDLGHFQNDQELHWHKLIEEHVEGEECSNGLFMCWWSVLEDILVSIIVFIYKLAGQARIDGSNYKDDTNVEGH